MDADVVKNCFLDPITYSDNIIDDLKHKVIYEFMNLLVQVEKGYKPEYEHILDEISLLEVYEELDKKDFILQYYLNL